MWPDEELDDEDELMEAVAEVYAGVEWTLDDLRQLLDRGGRRRKKPRRVRAEGPALLRSFLAECATERAGCTLGDGRLVDGSEDLYQVLVVGNGDQWVCDAEGRAHLSDHEAGGALSESIPLGRLLAAWLFDHELVARGLDGHSDADLYASELCPVRPSYLFLSMTF